MNTTKIYTCCDEQRIVCDEAFSYEVEIDENTGRLFVNTNDYCTDGFTDFRCVNCGVSVPEEVASNLE